MCWRQVYEKSIPINFFCLVLIGSLIGCNSLKKEEKFNEYNLKPKHWYDLN